MPEKAMTTAAVSEDAVRTRAYLMWEADGRPFGRDDHYWSLATAEMAAAGAAAGKPKRAAASSPVAEKTGKPKAAQKKAGGKKKQ
jgi:hypothetical protein